MSYCIDTFKMGTQVTKRWHWWYKLDVGRYIKVDTCCPMEVGIDHAGVVVYMKCKDKGGSNG